MLRVALVMLGDDERMGAPGEVVVSNAEEVRVIDDVVVQELARSAKAAFA